MKKKYLAVLLCIVCTLFAAGCGKQEAGTSSDAASADRETQESGSASSETSGEKTQVEYIVLSSADVEKCVTLGEYKKLSFTVNSWEATPENTYTLLNQIYVNGVGKEEGITDRAVETGDTVVIDYEGKKDGVAFAGGTAQGADLTIGSGQFIAGFEDGLIGVMPGETVDLNLTFPENYGNAELAGQAVVFTVTVQFIRPLEVPVEEMKDEVVADIALNTMGNTEIHTVAEMQEYITGYLEYVYTDDLRNSAVQALVEQCGFGELPESLLSYYRQYVWDYYGLDTFEEDYGYSADTYFTYAYGMTAEQLVNSNAEASVKEELAIRAVAYAENIDVSDEELQERFLEVASESGYKTVEEYIKEVGVSLEQFRFSLICVDVADMLIENAVITNTAAN